MSLHVLPIAELEGPASLPAQLRALADDIERNGNARTALIVLDLTDDGVSALCYGYRPRMSNTLGLLEYAKKLYSEGIK